MKERWSYLLKLYLLLFVINILQKPMFMLVDAPANTRYSLSEYAAVVWNGMLLDIPVTGYFIAIPLLFTLVSVFWRGNIAVRRIATPYYWFAAFLISLLFIADLSLYPFWRFKLDATIFYYLDSPKNAMASVSTAFILWRTVWVVLLTILYTFLFRWITPTEWKRTDFRTKERIKTFATLFLAIPLLIVSIRGGIGKSTANIGKVYFSKTEFLNHSAVNPVFSLIYSLDKMDDYASEFRYFAEEERKEIFSPLYPDTPIATDTVTLLNTQRPNIIVILMEGMGGSFTRDSIVSPHYHRLAQQGILFTNCYSNSYRTDRGMVSTLSGHFSYPSVSIMKLPIKSRTLPCIAASLNENGYHSSFLYGGDINFTNMQSYLRTGGYGTIVSDVDFTQEERETNDWGVNDDITFERLLQMMEAQKHTPWHIGFLTLSSHEPWQVPTHRLKEEIPNAFAFTDECLGKFVESIRQTPLWKDLLIVCIPDHGVSYPDGLEQIKIQHNTMLWIGGAVKQASTIETIMNQSDMAATLLGQLRIDHSGYLFSRDIFSSNYVYPTAYFATREGAGFIDSLGYTVHSIVQEDSFTDKTERERARKAKAILQTSYEDLGAR